MHRLSSPTGQASIDYVALLGLAAVVFAVAAATAGAPWLAPRLAEAIRQGICVVSGAWCTTRETKAAGLDPCPIHRRSDAERASATAVVRLERGDALLVERRSDGTSSVSFVDGGAIGAEVGIGVRLPGAGGSGDAGAGVRFNAGQTHEFATWDATRRFLARFAGQETMTGEGRRALRAICRRCPRWFAGARRELPQPAARFTEGGAYAEVSAALDIPGGELEGAAAAEALIGRRTAGRRVTHYLRLDGAIVAELGLVLGSLRGAYGSQGVLEITTQDGEPVLARVRGSAGIAAEGELEGRSLDVADIAGRLRGATTRAAEGGDLGGLAVEASVALDLRDPANRGAVAELLRSSPSPLIRLARVRALARRLDAAGAVDLAVFRTSRRSSGRELEAGAVWKVGAGYARVEQIRDLIAAWSLRAGEPLRRREDCEAAAGAVPA